MHPEGRVPDIAPLMMSAAAHPGFSPGATTSLPEPFAGWFAARGWQPRAHQLALIARAAEGRSVLLVAPTGGGKTLAGFLPSLIDLAQRPPRRKAQLHTLYISPLKALAVDVARNLETPVTEMGLHIRVETRTGDTPPSRRKRQRHSPPDILLTTPEQLALLLAGRDTRRLFENLKAVVLDELHALYEFQARRSSGAGAGATDEAGAGPSPRRPFRDRRRSRAAAALSGAATARRRDARRSCARRAGRDAGNLHLALRNLCALGRASGAPRHGRCDGGDPASKTALVFVNTRARPSAPSRNCGGSTTKTCHRAASRFARAGAAPQGRSGDGEGRAARRGLHLHARPRHRLGRGRQGDLRRRAQGAARLVQRIGRANHRLDEPSHALLVPANRFEVLECEAAREAVMAGELDGEPGAKAVSTCWRSMCSAWRARAVRRRRAVRGNYFRLALSPFDARRFRPGRRFRGDRRLCAQALRPLCEA